LRLTRADVRRDYKETRSISIGVTSIGVVAVAFTERSGAIRLISARRANRKERELYHAYVAQKDRDQAR
jgi:uncharacterized DUF497 family protein